jgi:hypothetical protein
MARRFPPRADKIPGGYVVRDANGQALVYVYSRDNEDEARQAKVLTKDEARRTAVNVARRGCSGGGLSPRHPTSNRRCPDMSARPQIAAVSLRCSKLPLRAKALNRCAIARCAGPASSSS